MMRTRARQQVYGCYWLRYGTIEMCELSVEDSVLGCWVIPISLTIVRKARDSMARSQ